ncbi:hypothetical protein QYE76_022369 [Lolium multiflorum]|uniref:Retrotransposon Copia-like N-terminal domain-containing protein n=1 Tax=Lolium multiflorum TaxID=4521 RepID=A0AAD8R9G4_LOLMU|nr:hypothetical protein QYE76_022369 [Lolium multiflorum]
MASSFSTSSLSGSPFGAGPTDKLGKGNFVLWQAQVLPAIRGVRLTGYLDGTIAAPVTEIVVKRDDKEVKEPNPAYEDWESQDQKVLHFLITSLSREVLPHAVGARTAAELWATLQDMYSTQSRSVTTNTRIALANAEKGNKTMAEYVAAMKSLENEMISAGKILEDEDMVSYILTGLRDSEYNSLVAAILARPTPITVSELTWQLGRGGPGRGNGGGGQGGNGYPNNGYNGYNNNNGGNGGGGRGRGNYNNNGRGRGNGNAGGGDRPHCQLCNVTGHVVKDCWYRFDEDFVPRERSAAHINYNTANYGGGNNNWHLDTGATDHITSELDRLHTYEKYNGNDQVHAANGAESAEQRAHEITGNRSGTEAQGRSSAGTEAQGRAGPTDLRQQKTRLRPLCGSDTTNQQPPRQADSRLARALLPCAGPAHVLLPYLQDRLRAEAQELVATRRRPDLLRTTETASAADRAPIPEQIHLIPIEILLHASDQRHVQDLLLRKLVVLPLCSV